MMRRAQWRILVIRLYTVKQQFCLNSNMHQAQKTVIISKFEVKAESTVTDRG
jgi:hypothetical protein